MLDVHPPHTPVHGWRDFLLHLATITIGLLIAIGLEQTVELIHHRRLVKETRAEIRHEIQLNEQAARSNIAAVQQNEDNMRGNMQKAGELLQNPHALDHGQMHFTFSWTSFDASAWRTARDTGALTYMPEEEVQRFDDIYNQQQIVDAQAVSIFTHQPEIMAPLIMYDDKSTIPAADVHALMLDSAAASMRLHALNQLIAGLNSQYTEALAK